MKTLTLIRHAKSNWSDPGATDHQRTLNPRGQLDSPVMGKRLAGQINPDLVLCSDAARAQETAQLLLPAMGFAITDITLEPKIYESSTKTLLEVIAEAPEDTQSLLLIGHNPGLESLCNRLLPGSISRMVTCAVCCFEIETTTWSGLSGKPIRLLLHDYPKNQ